MPYKDKITEIASYVRIFFWVIVNISSILLLISDLMSKRIWNSHWTKKHSINIKTKTHVHIWRQIQILCSSKISTAVYTKKTNFNWAVKWNKFGEGNMRLVQLYFSLPLSVTRAELPRARTPVSAHIFCAGPFTKVYFYDWIIHSGKK